MLDVRRVGGTNGQRKSKNCQVIPRKTIPNLQAGTTKNCVGVNARIRRGKGQAMDNSDLRGGNRDTQWRHTRTGDPVCRFPRKVEGTTGPHVLRSFSIEVALE